MISTTPGVSARRRRKKAPSSRGKENIRRETAIHTNLQDIDLRLSKVAVLSGVSEFKDAARSCAAASFWNKQSTDFVELVLESFSALSTRQGVLQLKESETSLVNAGRSCVKAATEEKGWNASSYNNLFVAAHGLRALHHIVETPETCIKLAYHGIVTLSDRLMASAQSIGISKVSDVASALYELMGRLLCRFQIDHTKFVASSKLLRFPVPLKSSRNASSATLPFRQVTKIGSS